MSFGPDIKETLQEIGTGYDILRGSGNISGEYLYYKTNRQVTKPFVREYFLEATMQYDSQCVSGDIIEFTSDTRQFLVAVLTPRNFENEPFDQQTTILKCNVSGELQRLSGEDWGDNYRREFNWQTIKSDCYGLLTEELYGNYLDQDSPAGQLLNKGMILYIPKSAGVQPLDRYISISGEVWKVEEIEKYVYAGVDVAHVEIDERQDTYEE